VAIVPEDGCIVARWDHDDVRDVATEAACEVRKYGVGQQWDGRIDGVDTERGVQTFTVLRDGNPWGRFECVLVGEHNLYNQVAAVAALERLGLTPNELAKGFAMFEGVKRRQEVLGEPRRVTVLDDFAHHPTAVKVTLEALRLRFGKRRMWAIFEPRSATSRRAVFQQQYAEAFDAADVVVIAQPHDQSRIPEDERFDSHLLVARLRARGIEAFTYPEVEDIVAVVAANALPWDVVAVLSNGGFGGLHQKLLAALGS
jgi:UDP-N-acetylmuramate: L-alanyl-gamma-D-glutamyl-meso-diaminopimelate ligase